MLKKLLPLFKPQKRTSLFEVTVQCDIYQVLNSTVGYAGKARLSALLYMGGYGKPNYNRARLVSTLLSEGFSGLTLEKGRVIDCLT